MRVLVDTSALVALNEPRDQHHARAVTIAGRHRSMGGRYVGTVLVLGELHSQLLYLRGPAHARGVLTALLDDPIHKWIEVSDRLAREATAHWLGRFADQRFSLVDAVSFEVMRQEKLTHAFAFDRHFEVAGFALLS